MDVLKQNSFMSMHMYLITARDTIMFQCSFTFESSTIGVLIFTG